jgi:hypothetical protein
MVDNTYPCHGIHPIFMQVIIVILYGLKHSYSGRNAQAEETGKPNGNLG